MSNLEAGTKNVLDTKDHVYHVGLLVEQKDGTTDLVVGSPVLGHNWLFSNYEKTIGAVSRILWAGEMEEREGTIIRVNETAGIIKSLDLSLVEGLEIPNTGINNLKRYLTSHKNIEKKYFKGTAYINYSNDDEHLNEALRGVSYLRHKMGNDLQEIVNRVYLFADNKSLDISDMPSLAGKILGLYNESIKLYPEFDTQEWRTFSAYLAAMANSSMADFATSKFQESCTKFDDELRRVFNNVLYEENTIVNRFDELTEQIKKSISEAKDLKEAITKNPELFTDESIQTLVDKAKAAPSRDEEIVALEIIDSIIQARDEIGRPIDSKLSSYYLKIKMNDLGGAKDRKSYEQRALKAFGSKDPEVIFNKLIEQRGKLINQDQVDAFTGSPERVYADSYFNQAKDLLSTNRVVLSIFLVLGVNENAKIEGLFESLLNHVVKYGKPALVNKLMTSFDNSDEYLKEKRELFLKLGEKVRINIEKAEREIKEFK